MNTKLILQLTTIILISIATTLWAINFPYPSPLVKPFLAPKQRYPAKQIAEWVDTGDFPSDFLKFFSRDPERKIPSGDNFVAPADGFVRETATLKNTTYLMIQLTFWDVHVVRSPVAGTIKSIEDEGVILFKTDPKDIMFLRGKIAPVQKIITISTQHGEVKLRMITNYWASRLKVWSAIGQAVEKGERIGKMLAGSTVVAEIPKAINLQPLTSKQVTAGESIIFDWTRQENEWTKK